MEREGRDDSPIAGEGQPPVRVFLLGGFRVEREGEPVPDAAWVRPQVKTLVKLLAVEPSHRLHRDQVIEVFWPDHPAPRATANLRRLLSFARRALKPEHPQQDAGDLLVARDELIALSPLVWVDADAFEREAREGLADGSVERLEAALALHRGELLPEDRYEVWTEERREDLAARHRAVLLALGRALAARGEWEQAAARVRQLLALDPTEEEAHRNLMRMLAASGNRREAIRQYERCRAVLAAQLGVEPDEETEALYQAIRSQTGGAAVQLPSAVLAGGLAPLIGRGRALEVLLDTPPFAGIQGSTARGVLAGERGAVVFVRGEAGIGKTRLAAEVARIVAGRGGTVLWGTCYRQLAYGPFAEALEQYVGSLPRAEGAALAAAHPELARVLPSLARATQSLPGDPAGDQLRLFASVGRFLAQLAESAPLVLVLDDLHLADDASVHLLVYLARLVRRHPWLILCTYRDEDVPAGGELEAAMSTLQQTGSSRRLELFRLSRRDADVLAEQVLGGPVTGELREHIFRLALGNPLFAGELLAGLRASGDLLPTDAGWALSPAAIGSSLLRAGARVGDLVATRVSALDESARRILTLVAAGGISITASTLIQAAALAGLGTEEALGGIEQALAAHVLVEQDEDYAFGHPLFRETVYAQLTLARRAAAHAALARAIEALRPDDVEALAYHYSQSGEREKRIVYLERAGDRARSIHANALAEQHYRDLLTLLSAHGDPDHIARVQLKLGTVLNVLGRYDEALAVLDEAAAGLAAAGDVDGLGRAVAAIGRVHVMQSTAADAVERLEGAIAELEGQIDPLVLSDLSDALARCLVALGRYAESEGVSERAIEILRQRAGTPQGQWHLARAGLQRASAAYFVRPSAEARMMLLAVMPVIERSGDPELLTHVYNLAAYSALAAGDLLESCRYYEQALEAAERMADPGRAGRFRCLLGRSWFFVGKGEQGLRIAEEGYAQLASFGPSLYLAFGSHMLGVIYLGMGRWQEAREHFAEVCAIAGENREAVRLAAYRAAQLDLLEGNAERARDRLEPLQSADAASYDAVLVCAHLAWACAALGSEDQALTLADRAVQQARVIESQLCLVEVLCACGATLVELRHWDAAERTLAEGLALAREIGYVWHEAVMQLLLARLRHRQGKLDAASAHLGDGRELLHDLGGEQAARMADAYAGIATSLVSPP